MCNLRPDPACELHDGVGRVAVAGAGGARVAGHTVRCGGDGGSAGYECGEDDLFELNCIWWVVLAILSRAVFTFDQLALVARAFVGEFVYCRKGSFV